MSESKDVALFGSKSEVPAHLSGLQGGEDHLTAADLAIPRLKLLQPMTQETDSEAGRHAGMFYASVVDKAYRDLYVINLRRDPMEYVVFKDMSKGAGGGWEGTFSSHADAAAHVANLPGTPSDYQIRETAKHLLVVLDDTGAIAHPAAMSMAGSALQADREWNTQHKLISTQADGSELPRYSVVWQLSSKKISGQKGTYYVPQIQNVGWCQEDLLAEVQKLESSLRVNSQPPANAA